MVVQALMTRKESLMMDAKSRSLVYAEKSKSLMDQVPDLTNMNRLIH